MKKLYTLLTVFLFTSMIQSVHAQTAKIEYIAHATFVVESSSGTRVLIDPYHSYGQLGYTFPTDINTDFILITHPHFDHDGSKSFSDNTPVYRTAGTYTYNDIKFYGIASKHAGWEGMEKRGRLSYNIIWVVEVDAIKIAHLGDNQILSAEEVKQLSDIDYVIGHPQDESLAKFSSDIVYIPNHYLLPEISKHTNWMTSIDGWLEDKKEVTRLDGNTFEFKSDRKTSRILVFKPSTKVKEWPKSYYDALAVIKDASKEFSTSKDSDAFLVALDEVIHLSPNTIEGYSYKAFLLSNLEKHSDVINVIEKAFVKVPEIDWSTEIRLRKMLAQAYEKLDQKKQAYDQYLWLYKQSDITDPATINTAKEFISQFENH
ncbi:MBL fold metallo-hydrolase [Dokdonia sp.]|uniref:MBL fold metallo-hydrolase n=1 Tax=Dokdonia sp. TaxID=2024995 RepID=UPI003263BCDD